jgi:hypothetical protein
MLPADARRCPFCFFVSADDVCRRALSMCSLSIDRIIDCSSTLFLVAVLIPHPVLGAACRHARSRNRPGVDVLKVYPYTAHPPIIAFAAVGT